MTGQRRRPGSPPLGASLLAEHSAPGLWWTVLADPEGNEFCAGSHQG